MRTELCYKWDNFTWFTEIDANVVPHKGMTFDGAENITFVITNNPIFYDESKDYSDGWHMWSCEVKPL